jgi:hypothetical protein
MPTYGGIGLAKATPELTEWVAANVPLSEVCAFRHQPRARLHNLNWPAPEFLRRPVRLGSLCWPVGASRWAVGHYLATEGQLAEIRALAYAIDLPNQTQSYTALDLVLDDGNADADGNPTGKITASLWMLPPYPLAQNHATATQWLLPQTVNENEEPLYLLTLVDDRYFWWDRAADLTVTEGETTWAQLFTALGTALGVTIVVDTIPAAYLFPPAELGTAYEYLPLVLDAAAASVGHRVVRLLDGTVATQGPATAAAKVNLQLGLEYARMAGGILALDAP